MEASSVDELNRDPSVDHLAHPLKPTIGVLLEASRLSIEEHGRKRSRPGLEIEALWSTTLYLCSQWIRGNLDGPPASSAELSDLCSHGVLLCAMESPYRTPDPSPLGLELLASSLSAGLSEVVGEVIDPPSFEKVIYALDGLPASPLGDGLSTDPVLDSTSSLEESSVLVPIEG